MLCVPSFMFNFQTRHLRHLLPKPVHSFHLATIQFKMNTFFHINSLNWHQYSSQVQQHNTYNRMPQPIQLVAAKPS